MQFNSVLVWKQCAAFRLFCLALEQAAWAHSTPVQSQGLRTIVHLTSAAPGPSHNPGAIDVPLSPAQDSLLGKTLPKHFQGSETPPWERLLIPRIACYWLEQGLV